MPKASPVRMAVVKGFFLLVWMGCTSGNKHVDLPFFFIWNLYLYNSCCPLRICAANIMKYVKYVCICSFCCGICTPWTHASVHFYRFQPQDCNLLCQKNAMFSVKSIGKKSQAQLSGMQALKEVFPTANSAQAPNSWHSSRSFWIFISSPPQNWITKGGKLKTSWFCSSLNNHHDKWVIEVLQFGLVDCHSANQNWLLIKSDHLGTLNSSSSVPLPWVWEEKYHAKNIWFFLPYLCQLQLYDFPGIIKLRHPATPNLSLVKPITILQLDRHNLRVMTRRLASVKQLPGFRIHKKTWVSVEMCGSKRRNGEILLNFKTSRSWFLFKGVLNMCLFNLWNHVLKFASGGANEHHPPNARIPTWNLLNIDDTDMINMKFQRIQCVCVFLSHNDRRGDTWSNVNQFHLEKDSRWLP